MKKIIKRLILLIYSVMRKVLPVSRKIILFESNSGRNYSGNPRYIYEEMVLEGLDKTYRCIWILENIDTEIPGNVTKIKRSRIKYYYYFCIAGFWIFDNRQPEFIKKKKGVTYIQTWHGTPLKKLGLDMDKVSMEAEKDIQRYHEKFVRESSAWDYLISQNEFSTKIFRRCFAFHKDVLEIGYPRNDVLIREKNNSHIWKEKLGIPNGKKVILYAPTWRDDQYNGESSYKFVTTMDFDKMRECLSDEYVMIVKYHYIMSDKLDWSAYKGFIYQFSESEDIAHLYLAADCLITDYSSVMFDYSILERPMFFYAYDLENYRENLRGFYFDYFDYIPGPVSKTTDELLMQIEQYDFEDWKQRYIKFRKEFNDRDDGMSASKVIEVIKEKSKKFKKVEKKC